MQSYIVLFLYCLCVMAASLAGGTLPWFVRLTHRRMQLVMSFVGGLMLGVALLHLLPHSVVRQGSVDLAGYWALGGLLFMFLLIRVFHVHAHAHGEVHDHHDHTATCEHDHPLEPHSHQHALPIVGSTRGEPAPTVAGSHQFSWVGLAFGLALHTIIDGLALGAAVAAEAHEQHGLALFGLGTFLAVALHKPLDAMSITTLMRAGGWSRKATFTANAVFALMCPLGALGFVFGLDRFVAQQELVVGCALAFSAGVFLCISLADLLPEVTFHSHDRLRLTTALFAGVAIAWGIGFLEPQHVHDRQAHEAIHQHDHDHSHGHSH